MPEHASSYTVYICSNILRQCALCSLVTKYYCIV